ELTNKPGWETPAKPLTAEFDFKVPGWASGAGRRVLMPVGLFSASEKHTFEHSGRVHPIYIRYPYETADDIHVALPAGWQVGSVPADQNPAANTHVVGYTLQVENGQSAVRVRRTMKVDFLILENKCYTALRTFFQAVRSGDEEQIVL